ncbi:PREDICTED: 3,9-dihydroxypterocarpan 6A-monooxygenase-like [Fragaria vesca subsp. vesca]|uniref:3,9-dihydroxypterocarpan 6A-monooxygenase-like n=1 Tax=Fragaria vesca subsp. vesca TaxID=101020 RepID=UPI0002C367EE|nr:PREDICTED: 3,9-dihydroxypterocarpan 6A-monooxygenase-like [Fragaria vesca subsp. vesca]XP_011463757.1 PREDICTED: 3,9-dihydroxypterocarpan 6A-monooxygenase-like [Fragaria vesca subsp. vesca]XP_011463758.1 PREDICTED: 3,9-dihydroxypterocarpan 6A-monooxygenase-like [Fragaria vesca subsp. vesca]XP_011463759.1 PREDICTED: 3,9-dihydroxypterocarpan 6A-monooxygenase-like [Fragaria vesca subsp. vesca]XP_011463760.1 PREDICTED: 3,9-dihydroxypterocarpan 6A-monooxygenase-like [Fragaria vesca subsp. vesca]
MWSSWGDASNEKDENLRAILLALLAMMLATLWFLWSRKKCSKNPIPPLPPGPIGLPLLGYLPFLGTDLHHELTDLARVYGPIYKLRLGSKLCVVISSPTLLKEMVRDHDIVFANHVPITAALVGSYGERDIAFGPYGPDWRRLRMVFVSKMLSKTNLDDSYALRREEVHKSIGHIYDRIGTPIDLGKLAFDTATNNVMRMLWGGTILKGEKAAEAGAEFRKAVTGTMELLGKPNVSDFFPALSIFDIQGIEREAKKLISVTDKILDSAIQQRMNYTLAEGERKDFLQFLLEYHNHEDSALSITMQQLKAVLTDIVVGGTETTTAMVEWVMAELIQHPDEMKKVQEELTQVVGLDNLVEEFHLPKLHHLDAVVKETLRLHPALPLLVPRRPSDSATIGGYTIPKGTTVFMNAYAIHRDPSHWDNPLEFRPQRFMDPSNKFDYLGNKFQYVPFGCGRRICAGLLLAERMLTFELASFLHSFEWRLPDDAKLDLSEKYGLVVKKMTPLFAIPTPRLSRLELYT